MLQLTLQVASLRVAQELFSPMVKVNSLVCSRLLHCTCTALQRQQESTTFCEGQPELIYGMAVMQYEYLCTSTASAAAEASGTEPL